MQYLTKNIKSNFTKNLDDLNYFSFVKTIIAINMYRKNVWAVKPDLAGKG